MDMDAAHSLKLGLILNFAVFHYEILNDANTAFTMTKTGLDECQPRIETLPEEQFKDTASILLLIRDNMTLWFNEVKVYFKFFFNSQMS